MFPQKLNFVPAVRSHYKKHPEALGMQESVNTIPFTVTNHSKT